MSFGGGGNYETPEMSEEEKELMNLILTEIEDQSSWNKQTLPIQMKEQGYKWQWNEGVDPEKVGFEADTEITSEIDALSKEQAALLPIIKGGPQSSGWSKYKDAVDRNKEVTKRLEYLNGRVTNAKENFDKTGKIEEGNAKYGSWVEMNEDEYYASLNDREKAQYNLNKKQMERSTQAIEGTLPLSETLLSQKDKEFNELKQVYGIEGDTVENAQGTDTVSTQNLSDFKKRWAQVEEAQRFGNSSSSTEAAILSSGLTTGQTNNNIGTMAAIGSGVGGAAGGYGSLLQPYQFYNTAGYQANAANQANETAQQGSMMGLLGMLAAAGMMASSKKFKKDIKAKTPKEEDEALKKIKKTKSYSYKYKPLMKMGDRKHIGTLTEESPEEYVTLNGNAVDIGDKIEYLSMGIKSLARKVDKIAAA
jgi:hypothetical protein